MARQRVERLRDTTASAERSGKGGVSMHFTIVGRMMRKMFDRQVAALGITRSQWTMILAVTHNPGATQRTIAEQLGMSEASAGRLIDRLCSENLLERRAREDDRRAHAVYLAPASRPLLDDLSTAGNLLEARLFRDFDQADLDELERLLDRMRANLERR